MFAELVRDSSGHKRGRHGRFAWELGLDHEVGAPRSPIRPLRVLHCSKTYEKVANDTTLGRQIINEENPIMSNEMRVEIVGG